MHFSFKLVLCQSDQKLVSVKHYFLHNSNPEREINLISPTDSGGEADRHRQRPHPLGRPQRAGADADHQDRPAHRAAQRKLARDRHASHDSLQVGE